MPAAALLERDGAAAADKGAGTAGSCAGAGLMLVAPTPASSPLTSQWAMINGRGHAGDSDAAGLVVLAGPLAASSFDKSALPLLLSLLPPPLLGVRAWRWRSLPSLIHRRHRLAAAAASARERAR